MKTIRKACVQAVFDEFETQGELVHPFKDGDVEAMRALGHIVGYVDLDVTGIRGPHRRHDQQGTVTWASDRP